MSFNADLWNSNGCACRCLIELARRKMERVIKPHTFVTERLIRYPSWKDKPGVTNTMMVCDIVRELGIADLAEVRRDYGKIVELSKEPGYVGTLMFQEREPDPADPGRKTKRCDHVMLLLDPTEDGFRVWNPSEKPEGEEVGPWPKAVWDHFCAHGLVLAKT